MNELLSFYTPLDQRLRLDLTTSTPEVQGDITNNILCSTPLNKLKPRKDCVSHCCGKQILTVSFQNAQLCNHFNL